MILMQAKANEIKPTRFLGEEGRVTRHFRMQFVRAGAYYVQTADFLANRMKLRPLNEYQIKEVQVVGSVVRGVTDSDLDLLVVPEKIDWDDSKIMKAALGAVLFANRNKYSAIDWYVQPVDLYPDKPSFNVTDQLIEELADINRKLTVRS